MDTFSDEVIQAKNTSKKLRSIFIPFCVCMKRKTLCNVGVLSTNNLQTICSEQIYKPS